MSMNKIKKNGMEIQFDEKTLAFSFKKEGQAVWTWEADYAPYMECGNLFRIHGKWNWIRLLLRDFLEQQGHICPGLLK